MCGLFQHRFIRAIFGIRIVHLYWEKFVFSVTGWYVFHMCLAQFAATYVTNQRQTDDTECDALPHSDTDATSTQIKLTDGFGTIHKCKQEAVLRFRWYNKNTEPSNWY